MHRCMYAHQFTRIVPYTNEGNEDYVLRTSDYGLRTTDYGLQTTTADVSSSPFHLRKVVISLLFEVFAEKLSK